MPLLAQRLSQSLHRYPRCLPSRPQPSHAIDSSRVILSFFMNISSLTYRLNSLSRGPQSRLDFPSHCNEAGMGDHSMIRPYAPALNRPGPQQRFKCFDHTKDSRSLKSLNRLHHLRDGGNKAHIYAARTKHLCGMWHHLPGLRKIKDKTIEWQTIVEQADTLVRVSTKRDEIRHGAHVPPNVHHRHSCEILTGFVGYHQPTQAHCPQEGHRQCPGTGPRLEHTCARINIRPHRNERKIFWIQHLRATRHLQHIIAKRGPKRQHRFVSGERGYRTIRLSDEVVVGNFVTAQLVEISCLQGQGILPPFLVDEMDTLT